MEIWPISNALSAQGNVKNAAVIMTTALNAILRHNLKFCFKTILAQVFVLKIGFLNKFQQIILFV